MPTYKDHMLNEGFDNLFLTDADKEKRRQYVDEVWDMFQTAYADQGGLLVNGARTKEDMINKIPFWKVAKQGGVVKAIVFYKDKGGRKRVAMAGKPNDPLSKKVIKEIMAADIKLKRGWGEISGRAWSFLRKNTPDSVLMTVVIPVEKVIKLSKGKEIIPGKGPDFRGREPDPFGAFYYQRNLGGSLHTKIALGQPGQYIK